MKNDVAAHFIERMGLLVEAEGMPRIAGRIFAFLILAEGPHSFAELAEELHISKGSVSTNTRLLENLGLIERLTQPGQRQDYFQLKHAPYSELLRGIAQRTNTAIELIQQTRRDLPVAYSGSQPRLQELEQFYQCFCRHIESMFQELAELSVERIKEVKL
ncbi:Putative HTH-type transcriptional regulator [Saliniradius amylolyticus]|uniref:HTH-type transcriptional regulator n=1 Tax=Saliniradius amylolyticus TaxID=2183582 RepID=A0A2S2E1W8_9ALTE|nr:MarR family transcriptional regulator [Saliniradius amylolyticus]AWL11589.1 Putative HTH-type transcriptional regulator [Saliniradius amylolyticus]